jgi:hypothetical protein
MGNTMTTISDTHKEIVSLAREGRTIDAIQLTRQQLGLTKRQAKDLVEAIMEGATGAFYPLALRREEEAIRILDWVGRMSQLEHEIVEEDDTADMLQVLCEDFGCEAGSNRIHWLHDRLSAAQEARDALRSIQNGPVHQLRHHQTQLDMDGIQVGVSRQAIEEVLETLDRILCKLEAQP